MILILLFLIVLNLNDLFQIKSIYAIQQISSFLYL